ncbi:hypothetical protein NEOC65_001038 [Neochlamydia sp. AcF65]|nr:hypothetical protein [Neochlamydia sp. AcF65]MBS4169835.1 hypothetical protein [Neochlamydia sp. AcF95]
MLFACFFIETLFCSIELNPFSLGESFPLFYLKEQTAF